MEPRSHAVNMSMLSKMMPESITALPYVGQTLFDLVAVMVDCDFCGTPVGSLSDRLVAMRAQGQLRRFRWMWDQGNTWGA